MKINQMAGARVSLGMLLLGCRSGMYSIDTDANEEKSMRKNGKFAWSFCAMVLAIMLAFVGCKSGLYKISNSEDGKVMDERMQYYVTGNIETCKEELGHGEIYDEQKMPVEVVEGECSRVPDQTGMTGILWMCTLGIFPMFHSEYMTQIITVKTPLGEKMGSYRVDAKWWAGWIPLFIGYPGFSDVRASEAELPNKFIEARGRNKLISSLAMQFAYNDYIAFAKNENANRKAELLHIADVTNTIENLLAKKDFGSAESLRVKESVKRRGSLDADTAIWERLENRIAQAKEDFFVSERKLELEGLMAQKKFEDVVSACNAELQKGCKRYKNVWDTLLNSANKSIEDRDRILELARIKEKKTKVERLLDEKKYAEVIHLCEEEKNESPGSRKEDAAIWASLKKTAADAKFAIDRRVELSRINRVQINARNLLDEKKYSEVVTICEVELSRKNAGWKSEDQMTWRQLLHKAKALDRKSRGILEINGFYLGMSVEDAHKRLLEVLPDMQDRFRVRYDRISIDDNAMPFCRSEQGRVVLFNFDMEWLERWFAYDDCQSDEEWVDAFAKQFGLRFARNDVKGSGRLPLWGDNYEDLHFNVTQKCYSYKSMKSGLKVAYFGDIYCSHSKARRRIGRWFFEGADYGANERTLRVSLLSGYSIETYERESGIRSLSQDSPRAEGAD